MPSIDDWVEVDVPYTVGPPKTVKPRGRPKKNKIKNSDEKKKRRHVCTRCNEVGHHKNSCKNPISNRPISEGSERGNVGGRGRGNGRGRGRGRRGRSTTYSSEGPLNSEDSSMGGHQSMSMGEGSS
ncbi:hypothetical protein QJS10_CPA16g00658 [Acorus calamus]|uniref:CCHC-type domain-containing protein n=1 Tax=Acorus calamus TaxID=4465 RepID=A0AAV9D0B0_ACOCL|nr:hypothetical protein QJS10_CPA16g00658 [Acorus calamus]